MEPTKESETMLLVRGNGRPVPLSDSDEPVIVSDKIEFLRRLGLKVREIAEVQGADISTISRWANSKGPEPDADGIDRLYVIARALLEGAGGQGRFVVGWLRSRNRALRSERGPVRPLDALKDGRYEDVEEAVRLLRGGVVASPPQPRTAPTPISPEAVHEHLVAETIETN